MNNNFTMLPNQLFYGADEKESYYKQHKDYKLLCVMDYLYINTNRKGISMFTLENMIIESGFKVDVHKGKSIDQFKEILKFLQFNKLIDIETNIDDLKKNDFRTCTYKGIEKNKDGNNICFTMLKNEDKEKILSYKESKIDNLKLLFYFSYLNSRMYKRSLDGNIECVGGHAEVCFPSYKTISDDIGFTDDTIKQYNNILVDLGLIKIGNIGLYYNVNDKNKIVKESPNFYALVNGKQDSELEYAMQMYIDKHQDFHFIKSREYKNNNRKVNGYIARINQLEREGKATIKQIEKKNSLIESVQADYVTIKQLKEEIMKLDNEAKEDIDNYLLANVDNEMYSVEDLQKLIEELKSEVVSNNHEKEQDGSNHLFKKEQYMNDISNDIKGNDDKWEEELKSVGSNDLEKDNNNVIQGKFQEPKMNGTWGNSIDEDEWNEFYNLL
ncbi:MAG: helix-turn-helix domain-containing protein [Clostridium neonatale]